MRRLLVQRQLMELAPTRLLILGEAAAAKRSQSPAGGTGPPISPRDLLMKSWNSQRYNQDRDPPRTSKRAEW